MAKQLSTDRGCASAKPSPDGARLDYGIKGEHGLRLRVTGDKAGNVSKIWSLLYTRRSDGKKCRLTLGEYPALSLAEACRLAGRHRNAARDGQDPAAERREAKQALTFQGLAELWLLRHAKVKKRSWPEDERMIRSNLLPALGGIKADAVTKADVLRMVHVIMDRGASYQANRNLSLVRTVFNWGLNHDLVQTNPALRIPMPAEEAERTRVLAPNEIRLFWAGIPSSPMTRPMQIALQLSLFTGARIKRNPNGPKSRTRPCGKPLDNPRPTAVTMGEETGRRHQEQARPSTTVERYRRQAVRGSLRVCRKYRVAVSEPKGTRHPPSGRKGSIPRLGPGKGGDRLTGRACT